MEIDQDSIDLLAEQRAEIESWPDVAPKAPLLRAIGALISDLERGAVSFVDICREAP